MDGERIPVRQKQSLVPFVRLPWHALLSPWLSQNHGLVLGAITSFLSTPRLPLPPRLQRPSSPTPLPITTPTPPLRTNLCCLVTAAPKSGRDATQRDSRKKYPSYASSQSPAFCSFLFGDLHYCEADRVYLVNPHLTVYFLFVNSFH